MKGGRGDFCRMVVKMGFYFQFCVRCNHNLSDFPPSNSIVREENETANKEYMKISCYLREFNDGIYSDPPKDANGEEIRKISTPAFKQEIFACKCFKDKGFNCIFKCFYNGKQYPYNNCPICKTNLCLWLTTKMNERIKNLDQELVLFLQVLQ